MAASALRMPYRRGRKGPGHERRRRRRRGGGGGAAETTRALKDPRLYVGHVCVEYDLCRWAKLGNHVVSWLCAARISLCFVIYVWCKDFVCAINVGTNG